MTTAVRTLTKKALALKPEERVELAEALLVSVDDFPTPELDAAWREEVRRRIEEIESGQAKLVSSEEVHRKARAVIDEAGRLPRRR